MEKSGYPSLFYGMNESLKIIVTGNYGARNMGDEALLAGMQRLLKHTFANPVITVLSYDPEDTKRRHHCNSVYQFPFGIRSFLRGTFRATWNRVRISDLVILGGGGLLTDEKIKAMLLWGYHILLFSLLRKKIVLLGNSIGPVKTFFGKMILNFILKRAVHINLRDNISRNALGSKVPSEKISVSADLAFCNETPLHIPIKKRQVAISLRPWISDETPILATIADFCNKTLIPAGYSIVLLPFQTFQDNDRVVLHKLYDRILNKRNVQYVAGELELQEILDILSESEVVLGMRLHALILATMTGTPFIGLGYSQKVRGFTEEAGQDSYYVELANLNFKELLLRWNLLQENSEQIRNALMMKRDAFREKNRELENILASL